MNSRTLTTSLNPTGWMPARLSRPNDDSFWHVVRTKSRQEKALARDLAARRLEFFLPLATTWRYSGARKLRSIVPLFPGYIFVFASVEQSFEVDRTDRVAQVIRVSDQAALLGDLEPLHEALLRNAPLRSCPPIQLGDWVEVKSGPFRGIRGRVEQGRRADRLVLQVDLIGSAAVLEIEESLLAPVTS